VTGNHENSRKSQPRQLPSFGRRANSRRIYGPLMSVRLLLRNRKGNIVQKREKLFRDRPGIPLDRNAKARIIAYVRGYNAKHKRAGQPHGPITRAFLDVLEALLWGFHNSRTGKCFPGYDTIAEKARCCRDTVHRAINALESADVLTWANRFDKIKRGDKWQIIRTSNAYAFRDPLPCVTVARTYKSENPAGTSNQDNFSFMESRRVIVLNPANTLDSTLISLGRAMGALPDPNAA
jgi:helix-turn-helix protein